MEQTLTEPCAIGRPLSRVQMGNYLLLRELGQGGYANVYLAEHLYLKHQVALKLLNLSLTQHEDLVRFQFAIQDEKLEELQMAHDRHAVTAPNLVPLPQPEQRNDFLSGKAMRSKFVLFRNYHLCVHCSFELLFCIHVCIHRRILSIVSIGLSLGDKDRSFADRVAMVLHTRKAMSKPEQIGHPLPLPRPPSHDQV